MRQTRLRNKVANLMRAKNFEVQTKVANVGYEPGLHGGIVVGRDSDRESYCDCGLKLI